MQFKRQIKQDEGVNLTPLIDVVFLLLIFFMVSTTFTKESHLKIDLPEAVGEKQPQSDEKIEVVVDAQGGYAVNGKVVINKQKMTLETAINQISAGDTSLPFIVTGDANANWQSIVAVMDLAGQLGFVNLSMTAQTPDESNSSLQSGSAISK